MPGKVPDRWEDYSPFGKPIEGTRFIACKVPLEVGICRKLKDEKLSFSPSDLMSQLAANNWKLGLLIDLTNTNRYYQRLDILSSGVEYDKINTEGHVIPNNRVVRRFTSAMDKFLEENKDNERLIGVHCTHGVNRTGYLICRYMITKLDFKAEEAIKAFNDARGYEMERENYLEDLLKGNWPDPGEESPRDEREMSPRSYSSRDQYKADDFHNHRSYPERRRNSREERYGAENGYRPHPYHSRTDGSLPYGRPHGYQDNSHYSDYHGYPPYDTYSQPYVYYNNSRHVDQPYSNQWRTYEQNGYGGYTYPQGSQYSNRHHQQRSHRQDSHDHRTNESYYRISNHYERGTGRTSSSGHNYDTRPRKNSITRENDRR